MKHWNLFILEATEEINFLHKLQTKKPSLLEETTTSHRLTGKDELNQFTIIPTPSFKCGPTRLLSQLGSTQGDMFRTHDHLL